MMSRTLRTFALTLAVAFLASALAQTTLTFWSWRTEDVAAYEQFIAAFRAENPDIDVTFTPYLNTEYNTILSTALQGGGGPDIVHLRAYGGMESLAQAGLLVRLDGKVAALEGFDPGVLLGATNRADGGVYGVPFALQTVQVLYNIDMFERLGLEEPTTWAELLAVGDALKASGVYAFANGTKDGWTNETLFGAVRGAEQDAGIEVGERGHLVVEAHQQAGLGERLHAAVGAQVDDVGAAAALQRGGEDGVVLGVQVGREGDVDVGVLGVERGDELLVGGDVFGAPAPEAEGGLRQRGGREGEDQRDGEGTEGAGHAGLLGSAGDAPAPPLAVTSSTAGE